MDCLEKCKQGALRYAPRPIALKSKPALAPSAAKSDASRRSFLSIATLFTFSTALKAQQHGGDGGLAVIEEKKIPRRTTSLVPPGAASARNFARQCTACQLCVSACPNQVLRPSADLMKFMQPEMSFERGYCRPECVKCSEVCPAAAINSITPADKSATQIGHAVWIKDNCVVLRDEVTCTNCERHCPTGAIQLVPQDAADPKSPKTPVIDIERCIGCGACENLCPARPFSAIYVEGHEVHKII
jgi:formate hydrogenlyase subunit 6/NADH:ubiquinone oxidoreductase subunit I